MKYIIEHLEPEVFEWCLSEYEHISRIVGKENLIFTNIIHGEDKSKLTGLGEVYEKSIRILINSTFDREKSCLLDPNAEQTLSPFDVGKFEFLVFGGILGDNPPQARTKNELGCLGIESRNLGKEQMATDNAVYVAKEIISGKNLDEIKFKDGIEIKIKEGEEVILPYKYVLADGKPLISSKLVKYLKEKEGF